MPAKDSKRRFKQPKNVGEFAAQTNAVATMLLNGEMPIDTAKTFSALARTVAQAMSAEVHRARMNKTVANLELPANVFVEGK